MLDRWRSRFDFLLVDEFQDTNRAQYELIKLLGLGHRNVFGVGDEDQSIYGWRGADLRNLRDLQRDFGEARAGQARGELPLDPADSRRGERGDHQQRRRIAKTLRTRRPGGESIVVRRRGRRARRGGVDRPRTERRAADGAAHAECAVLYRTNAQSRALEEAMRRAGVPYQIVGAISFYDRREVKDMLAYLRLIANPSDDEAFIRAIAVPRRGIGDVALATLAEQARAWQLPLLAAAARADTIAALRPNLQDRVQDLRRPGRRPAAAVRRIRAGHGDGGGRAGNPVRDACLPPRESRGSSAGRTSAN